MVYHIQCISSIEVPISILKFLVRSGANSHSDRHCQRHLGGIGVLGEDDEQKTLISGKSWWKTAETLVNLQKLQVNQRDDQGYEDNHQVEFQNSEWRPFCTEIPLVGFSVATLKSHDHPPRSKKNNVGFQWLRSCLSKLKMGADLGSKSAGWIVDFTWSLNGPVPNWFQIGSEIRFLQASSMIS